MSISDTYRPCDARQPRGKQPWCGECDTDEHLEVDSVTVLDRQQGTLAVAFNCTNCGGSRVLDTTPDFVAAVLARAAISDDVVHLAGEYIHCGEPMSATDPELMNPFQSVSTDEAPPDVFGVYLQTRVLRCRCGFQMEIPS